jgi:hypothetical protein
MASPEQMESMFVSTKPTRSLQFGSCIDIFCLDIDAWFLHCFCMALGCLGYIRYISTSNRANGVEVRINQVQLIACSLSE